MYMNPETGSVDTEDGWIYTDENGISHNPVKEGTVTEVFLRSGTWAKTIDLTDVMTPEEIEEAEKAEKEYRRKFASAGGSVKSEKKADAARKNGKKGGRPRINLDD